jgi:glutamate dehydrogenase
MSASKLTVPGQPTAYSTAGGAAASDPALHRIKNVPGYTTPVFKEKEEQRAQVQASVAAKVRLQHPTQRPLGS